MTMSRRVFVAVLLSLACGPWLRATVIVAPTFDELVQQSEWIAVARVAPGTLLG